MCASTRVTHSSQTAVIGTKKKIRVTKKKNLQYVQSVCDIISATLANTSACSRDDSFGQVDLLIKSLSRLWSVDFSLPKYGNFLPSFRPFLGLLCGELCQRLPLIEGKRTFFGTRQKRREKMKPSTIFLFLYSSSVFHWHGLGEAKLRRRNIGRKRASRYTADDCRKTSPCGTTLIEKCTHTHSSI